MTKVVYNACYGGFSLSYAAVMRYAELKGIKLYGFTDARDANGRLALRNYVPVDPATADDAFCIHYRTKPSMDDGDTYFSDRDIDRADPALVQVVEELGDKADGQCARLCIEEIPTGTQYRIDEYDGNESVATRDSYEWKTA